MDRLGEGQHRQARREEQDREPEQDRPARAAQVIVVGLGVGAGRRRAQQAPRQQGRDRGQNEGDEEDDRQRDPLPEAQIEEALAAKRGREPVLERRAPCRRGGGCRLRSSHRGGHGGHRGGSKRRRRGRGRRCLRHRRRHARERDQHRQRDRAAAPAHQLSRAGRASVVCSASARNGADEIGRHPAMAAGRPIDPDVTGVPIGEQRVAAPDLVAELHRSRRHPVHPRDDAHHVTVARSVAVGHVGARHHQEVSRALDVGVRPAGLGAQARARDFEPHQVGGVVDHAHLVGLGIADLDLGGAREALQTRLQGDGSLPVPPGLLGRRLTTSITTSPGAGTGRDCRLRSATRRAVPRRLPTELSTWQRAPTERARSRA